MRMRTRRTALPLALAVVALVLASCGALSQATPVPPTGTPLAGLPLTQTHLFPGFGFSIDYPEDWVTATQAPVSLFAGTEADLADLQRGASPQGVILSHDHRGMSFMQGLGLPEDPSPEDLYALNAGFFGWGEPVTQSEVTVLGAPALRARVSNGGRWEETVMGYVGDQAYLLSVEAPSEEALDDFLPTFEAMLASAEAVGE